MSEYWCPACETATAGSDPVCVLCKGGCQKLDTMAIYKDNKKLLAWIADNVCRSKCQCSEVNDGKCWLADHHMLAFCVEK